MYRLLLRLLPRHRRVAYGDEMREVFLTSTLNARARGGTTAVFRTWVKELFALVMFAWHDRVGAPGTGGASPFGRDLRWAVRGLRARGWTGLLSIGLLSLAMTAGTLVFASADALIFNRVPYPEPDRLVGFPMMGDPATFHSVRERRDLLSHVSAHQPAVTFLTGGVELVQVDTAYVVPGFFETLGVLPAWGRPLTEVDRGAVSPTVAVIDASLARERFGSPQNAVGNRLETDDRPLTVVGVMPTGFRYPNGTVRIWRALDHERLNPSFSSMTLVARLAPGVSVQTAATALTSQVPSMASRATGRLELRTGLIARPPEERARTLHILLGAAICLLLAACANVVSLEVAGSIQRAREFGIQAALGATRSSLVRSTLLESLLLVGTAFTCAGVMTAAGVRVLPEVLPTTIALSGVNPIDVDWRALGFMGLAATVLWTFTSLPMVLQAGRPAMYSLLEGYARGAAGSRSGTRARRWITIAEVALSVLLLAGGLLYIRSYTALLALDTGLETRGVLTLSARIPTTIPASHIRSIESSLRERLQSHPGVLSVSRGSGPPGNAYTVSTVPIIDGVTASGERVNLTTYFVDPEYFQTVGLRSVRGRTFDDSSDPSEIVITESLARRFWRDADPIGSTLMLQTRNARTMTVVGVVPHVRTDRDPLAGPSPTDFVMFRPLTRLTPSPSSSGVEPAEQTLVNAPSGQVWNFLSFLVKTEVNTSPDSIVTLARSVDPRARYLIQSLDEAYALRHAETRMAATIMTAFAGVAFLVATAGVFGLMTFLVVSRTREIGIRMALGADRRDVGRLVMGSVLRLAVLGVALGIGAALVASRWIESQLFSVTGTDPLTLAVVALVVLSSALLSTWNPARRASRIDPAITLRAE